MPCLRLIAVTLALLSAYTLPAAIATANDAGKIIIHEGIINEDLYSAGERVDIRAQVNGDVVAAGGHVRIDNQVSGDIIAAGGRVDIGAQVQDDVRVAGGEITISNRVDGDVIAAGGHVRLERSAVVGERAWLAGGDIEIDGDVEKELRAAGGNITLSGRINGDVQLITDSLRILPTAQINGNLEYQSPLPATIASQAFIAGTITHSPIEHERSHPDRFGSLVFLLMLLITAAVYYLIYPHFAQGTLITLGQRPGASFGLGLALLFLTPPLIALLMVTVIGSLIGVVILLLYPVLLFTGFLTGMLFVSDGLLRLTNQAQGVARGKLILALTAAFLLLWLLGFLPVIGPLLVFAALLFGSGALLLKLYQLYNAYREVQGET